MGDKPEENGEAGHGRGVTENTTSEDSGNIAHIQMNLLHLEPFVTNK